MAIQVIVKNIGGTIETMFLDRHVSSCTVTVYTSSGGSKSTGAGTVDTLSTTLSAAVDAGDTEIPLASATSCYVGRRYLVGTGPGSQSPAETVSVRELSASTAVLWAPLALGHAVGAAVKGVRVTYAIAAAAADQTWFGGYAVFDPTDGSDPQAETVECFRTKIPTDGCDESDLRLVFADLTKAVSGSMDLLAAKRLARDLFLYDLGGKNRANAFIVTDIARRAVALKFWLMRRGEFGDAWKESMDGWETEYKALVLDIQGQNPADNDQDGTTDGQDDGGWTVGTVERA